MPITDMPLESFWIVLSVSKLHKASADECRLFQLCILTNAIVELAKHENLARNVWLIPTYCSLHLF